MSDIITVGDPVLETPAHEVQWPDPDLHREIAKMHRVLSAFRAQSGFGRAVSAPQIGIGKRVIAINLGARPFCLINPVISWRSEAMFEVWDDCLSVPDQIVRVLRHCEVSVDYQDEQGRTRQWHVRSNALSELIQHEIDHLDGVLMLARAIDEDSIRPASERHRLIDAARSAHRLSLDAIASAADTIDDVFRHSPQYPCDALGDALGCAITLKVETTNPIRSFKGRGADFFVSSLEDRNDHRALVCASAGNFGQALAYACRRFERPLTVYASEHASPLKIERMRAFGADVRLEGEDFDGAKAAARRFAEAQGGWMVEDGREPEISEGAGSIGVELLDRGGPYNAILVPLGNGALLNGIARWVKASDPATEIIGVSARGADAMAVSWRSGEVVTRPRVSTVADGIAVRVPIPEAVSDMSEIVDDVVLVGDENIISAMRLLHEHAGLVVEPAGAVGVAALIADPERFRDTHIATIICGSNLTQEQISSWLGVTTSGSD